ncbi:MAG: hypothetical protein RL172_2527, partial [Bacteroidota bacterium]
MKAALFQLQPKHLPVKISGYLDDPEMAQLVLCFSSKARLAEAYVYDVIRQYFPQAAIAMCSTAGEICQSSVYDDSMVAVALQFDKTTILPATVNISDYASSYDAGIALTKQLTKEDLRYVMVLSDGALVNGSELVKGLAEGAGEKVLVTGGLAGDGSNFTSTLVGLNMQPAHGEIVAIGFYGEHIVVTHGSQGGWDMFGLEKQITRSADNVLYEIDGQCALDLYKKYLGPDASGLPGSALLFP